MSQPDIAPPKITKSRISPFWALPLTALLVTSWLIWDHFQQMGSEIQIYFANADGLIAGRTTVRYQGLQVGLLKEVKLADDNKRIVTRVQIFSSAMQFITDHSQFWLVKPQASLQGVTGLDALVSGNYVALKPQQGEPADTFTALPGPPSPQAENQGINLVLKADDLDAIGVGAKVLFKKIPIGEVYDFQLAANAEHVLIQVHIDAQYQHLVKHNSRFWNMSGVGAKLGTQGLEVQFPGMKAILSGAIALDSPAENQLAADGQTFKLYPNLKSAGRGVDIQIDLPENSHISPNGAPIMFKGFEVGQITQLKLSEDKHHIRAFATIEPSFSEMLTTGSRFIIEEAQLSLGKVKNIANLVKGNHLTLVPGKGQKSIHFTALHKAQQIATSRGNIQFILTADESFGLEPGSPILFKGLKIGAVTKVKLHGKNKPVIHLQVNIEAQYAHLIRSQSLFYLNSSAQIAWLNSQLNINLPSMKQLLDKSISFIPQGTGRAQKTYKLYGNKPLAELAKQDHLGSTTLTLFSEKMPAASKGSPILYRQLPVGKVMDFKLVDEGVATQIKIDKQYQHLLTADTVFWGRSGVDIEANLAGIRVQAAPLSSLLQGGIEFDRLPNVKNKSNGYWKLYTNYKTASQYGQDITLHTEHVHGLTVGSGLKYKGVQVGEVVQLTPIIDEGRVDMQARIYPQYVKSILRDASYFWLVVPKFSLAGAKDLDALISPYIQVEPAGHITARDQFDLSAHAPKFFHRSFQLESDRRHSVKVGTPVLYREMKVGEVENIALSKLSDKVLITIIIEQKHAHLVRQNTLFWNTSGVDASFGITGVTLRSGTIDSLLQGGITFATPMNHKLAEPAVENQQFELYLKAEPEWLEWAPKIPAN